MDDNSKMPFGTHKGKALIDVPASYLIYCLENMELYGELKEYIEDNIDILREEAEKEKQKKR